MFNVLLCVALIATSDKRQCQLYVRNIMIIHIRHHLLVVRPCNCVCLTYYRPCMQVKDASARNDDAAVVTDVYRVAFEEQLERNKELLRRLGDLTLTPPHMSRTDKAKAAVKWLIKQLNEGQTSLHCCCFVLSA